MKALHQQRICAIVCSLMAATAAASPGEKPAQPVQAKSSQEVLAAMSRSSI